MLSLLRRKSTSSSSSKPDVVVEETDLSSWELVNHTDDEIEQIIDFCSFDDDDVITDHESSTWISPEPTFPVKTVDEQLEKSIVDEEDDDVEKDDDVYGDEVDDDLVPWEFKGRFGKQRMGKVMGKKCVPKSKYKLPCYYHHKPKSNILVR